MRMRRRPTWIIISLALLVSLCLSLVQIIGQAARAQPACDLIVNGGFEGAGGWTAGADLVPPRYASSPVKSGQRSLLLGLPPGSPGQQSNSSVKQTVMIPADAASATLSFWYQAGIPAAPSGDYAEFVLLAADGVTPLTQSWRSFVSNGTWNQVQFDLRGWRGQTITLDFNVHNDGATPTAYMYLDDVSLPACPGGGTTVPTPTPTSTLQPGPPTSTPTLMPTASSTTSPAPTYAGATDTPVPSGTPSGPLPPPGPPSADCVDLVHNGSFEDGLAGWETAPNRLPVQIVNDQVRWGNASLRLGTTDQNLNSYSSVGQPIQIPAGYVQVLLDFWTWTWAESPPGDDHQEADFLGPDGQVLQKFWRTLANDQSWVEHTIPVSSYAGRDVIVYFNVYNDGVNGRAGMYLDEVHVWACSPYGPGAPYGGKAYPGAQSVEPQNQTAQPGSGVIVIPPVPQAAITGTVAAAPPTVAAALPAITGTVAAVIPTAAAALPTLGAVSQRPAETLATSDPSAVALSPTALAAPSLVVTPAPPGPELIGTLPPLALPLVEATPAPNQTTLSLGLYATSTPLPRTSSPAIPPGLLDRLPTNWPIYLLVILGIAAILVWWLLSHRA